MGINSAFKGLTGLLTDQLYGKLKVIFTLEQTIKAQRGSRDIVILFL
jgi:hypothetical protein